jgi:hypothetical protein
VWFPPLKTDPSPVVSKVSLNEFVNGSVPLVTSATEHFTELILGWCDVVNAGIKHAMFGISPTLGPQLREMPAAPAGGLAHVSAESVPE